MFCDGRSRWIPTKDCSIALYDRLKTHMNGMNMARNAFWGLNHGVCARDILRKDCMHAFEHGVSEQMMKSTIHERYTREGPRFESKARALWPHELRHGRRAQSEGGAKVSLQKRRAAARGHRHGPWWHAVCGEFSLRFEEQGPGPVAPRSW